MWIFHYLGVIGCEDDDDYEAKEGASSKNDSDDEGFFRFINFYNKMFEKKR